MCSECIARVHRVFTAKHSGRARISIGSSNLFLLPPVNLLDPLVRVTLVSIYICVYIYNADSEAFKGRDIYKMDLAT